MPDFTIENEIKTMMPNALVIGIDESGRGPLAGPVVAAAVFLDHINFPRDINDSKKLTKNKRKKIFDELKIKSFFGIGIVDEKKIDKINILEATKLAMYFAYQDLCQKYHVNPQFLLIDGNIKPFAVCDQIKEIITVIKGDTKSFSIAAASIIAKETRDEIMNKIDRQYPHFNFRKNAGYPTKEHVKAIKNFGICEFHRKSFEPIKSMLES